MVTSPRRNWGPIVLFAFPWILFNVYFSIFPRVTAASAFRLDQKSLGLLLLLNQFMSSRLWFTAMCLAFGQEKGLERDSMRWLTQNPCPWGARVLKESGKSCMVVSPYKLIKCGWNIGEEAVHSDWWNKGRFYREASVCVGPWRMSAVGLGRSHSCSRNYRSKDK